MAIQISRAETERMVRQAQAVKNRAKNMMERAESAISHVVDTIEIGASSFLFGLVQGRYGGVEILGVPIDLGAALVGHLGAFFMDGPLATHVHSLANGAFACFSVTMGQSAGAAWYEKTLTPDQLKTLTNARKAFDDAKRAAGIRGEGLTEGETARYFGRAA